MSTVKRVAKNSFYNFFGNNVTKIVTMLLTIFIARFFSDVDFGKLSFALSFTGLFIILIDLGTRLLLVRDIASDKKNASSYVSSVMGLKLISSALVFGFVAVLINLMQYPQDTTYAVYIGALIIIFESFSISLQSVFQAFEKLQYPAYTKIFRVLLRFAITLPFLFMGYGLITVMLIYLFVQIVNFAVTWYLCSRVCIPLSFRFDGMKPLVIRGWPFLLSSAFVMVYFRIDITMLSVMQGDAVVGWYSASYTLLDALISIPIALNAALLPLAVKYAAASRAKLIVLYKSAARLLLMLAMPLAVGGTLLASPLILFVFGEKYSSSVFALQVLLWVLLPLFVVQLLGALLIALKKEKQGVPALFLTTVVNIVANLILIPQYSLIGAAIATIISEIVYLFMYYLIVSKEIGFVNVFAFAVKPLLASVVMGLFVYFFSSLHFAVLIVLGGLVYFGMLVLLGGFTQAEKEMVKRVIGRG